jgi:hypothetical protein
MRHLQDRCLKAISEAETIVNQQASAEKATVLTPHFAPPSPMLRRPSRDGAAMQRRGSLADLGPASPMAPFTLTLHRANHEAMCCEYADGRWNIDLDAEACARVRAAGFSADAQVTPLKKLVLNAPSTLPLPSPPPLLSHFSRR